jgi:hypothetical protein
MKSLITSGNGTAELIDSPDPVAGAGELLVVPIAAGICGTDLEIISGDGDPAFVKYPASLGHEWVGRVIGYGPGVSSPAIGSRIVVTGIIPCQECFECKNGDTNRCLIYDEIGFTRPGAAAELITVPAWLAHVVKDNVSDECAVLAEPTAVVTAVPREVPSLATKPEPKTRPIRESRTWPSFVRSATPRTLPRIPSAPATIGSTPMEMRPAVRPKLSFPVKAVKSATARRAPLSLKNSSSFG